MATLVLDMRGTLMCNITARHRPDLVPHAQRVGSSLVLKRPFLDEFLERMSVVFELVVFTSCGEKTADEILNHLDPAGKYFSRRLYSKSCKQNGAVKDLSVLGRPMERVVIIDDSFKKCTLNPDNWVPISTFRCDLADRKLLELVPFLEKISEMEDVRPAIREAFGSKVAEERMKLLDVEDGDVEVKEKVKMKGHQVEGSGRITALGMLLCKILRHRAVEFGLHLRSDGYCKVDDLLKLDMKTRSKISLSSHSLEDVMLAVERNTKKRLSTMVEDDVVYIRASQGHSIKEVVSEDLLTEINSADEVPICVHGTFKFAMESIMKEGLKVMGRNHVHFATGLPGDGVVLSGIRKDAEVLIYLDVDKAMKDGMRFFMSQNNVVLTEGFQGTVPSTYFEKIVDL